MKNIIFTFFFLLLNLNGTFPDNPDWDFDAQLQAYFKAETARIQESTNRELSNITDWDAYQKRSRLELQEMFGLLPFPEKTPLKATITGTIEHEDFIVEKLHFQSVPGLYVTANLYIPKNITKPVPAIIYVCGHATIVENGYNYGAKVRYQHHPAWFARHGYVCIILDTVQLGEIEGMHHGLYRHNRWWWMSRGYTPAGVETWNGIRAIDYLVSRPEVDAEKIGITGRSGGGATSWWVAPLDDRIKVVVPVAGITDMFDHVVEGCVEGHCDCMYIFNTHRWDYAKVAALIAPRPLLISNSDRDVIFPITGVFRTYQQVRSVYDQLEVSDHVALHTTAGPHKDTQELRIHAFRWFNHFLKDSDALIEKPAVKFFTPEDLRVFKELPKDAINDRIDDLFVPKAGDVRNMLEEKSWDDARDQWYKDLTAKVFRCWPEEGEKIPSLKPIQNDEKPWGKLITYSLQTDGQTALPLFHIQAAKPVPGKQARVVILDDENWPIWANKLASGFPGGYFWNKLEGNARLTKELKQELQKFGNIFLVNMRGTGLAKFGGDDKKEIQIRRRYYLLGQSMEAMQTWDILQAIRSIHNSHTQPESLSLNADASGSTAAMLMYASLYFEARMKIQLRNIPESHDQGPYYLNILKYLDIPATILMAAEKHDISFFTDQKVPLENTWYPLIQLGRKYPQLSLQLESN